MARQPPGSYLCSGSPCSPSSTHPGTTTEIFPLFFFWTRPKICDSSYTLGSPHPSLHTAISVVCRPSRCPQTFRSIPPHTASCFSSLLRKDPPPPCSCPPSPAVPPHPQAEVTSNRLGPRSGVRTCSDTGSTTNQLWDLKDTH